MKYECNACGKKFETEKPAPRCPKCLRRTSVKEAPPAPVEAEAKAKAKAKNDPPAISAEPTPEEKRSERLLAVLIFPAALAAFMRAGFFKITLATPAALVLAGLGAIAWAMLAFPDLRRRARAGISAVVATSGMVLAIAYYLEGRSTVFNIEVLVPMILGMLPGLFVYRLLKPLTSTKS